MSSLSHRILATLLPGLAVLLTGSLTLAQQPAGADATVGPTFRPNALGFQQPAAVNEGTARLSSTVGGFAAPVFNPTPYSSTSYVPGPYGNVFAYTDPYSGRINAYANYVSSVTQGRIANQQARLVQEQVSRSKVDTKRKALEEWLYEREVLPTYEDERERNQMEQLRRSLNNPPGTEIWAGIALNNILANIQKIQASGVSGPTVGLPYGVLDQINFTGGPTPRGPGMLRDGPDLNWPYCLQDDSLSPEKAQIDKSLHILLPEAPKGRVDGKAVRDLFVALNNLEGKLKALIQDMTPTDYINAKRYISQLQESCQIFKQQNVGSYFAQGSRPEATTVAALVNQMGSLGLTFAPADMGHEPAYTALYRSMVAYDTQLTQLVARPNTPNRTELTPINSRP